MAAFCSTYSARSLSLLPESDCTQSIPQRRLREAQSLRCDPEVNAFARIFPLVSCMLRRMRWPSITCAVVALAAANFAGSSLSQSPLPQANQGAAVLELFTSQGCSSCPPADALLGQLDGRPGLLVLSYSVDYWDYLGWHDTLGSAANSDRQRDYARERGDGQVYTPQMVVDGIIHVNGADETAIEQAMHAAEARLTGVQVPVAMHAEGDTLVIEIGPAPAQSQKRAATVWLAIAKDVEKVVITRGENRGREISYHHPVRELTPIGMWKGEAMTLRLPLKEFKTMGGDCVMALLQVESAGAILGAAQYERP
jgi:hypothetical protein